MFRKISTLAALAAGLFFLAHSALAATYFTANLNGAQEVPPTSSTANGFGRVTLNEAETQFTISVYYSGLSSGVTGGHIHGAAPVGSNAGIIFDLNPTGGQTSGSVVNLTFSLNSSQLADLKAGLWYLNIHTTNNPGGEIRGQIFLDAPFVAFMDNNQENPPTNSASRGSGVVSLNESTNQALVTMSWSGLTGVTTAAHIHAARVGINGPAICNLNPPSTAAGTVVDVLCSLTAAQVTALKQAQLYLNIHTASFPGGEIRGQIQRRRSTVLDFDGDSKTDFAIARNNSGANQIEWWILSSGGGVSAFPHGNSAQFSTTRIVACDFDGDGKDDPAIWQSAATPNAGFLIFQSGDSTVRFEPFGTTGDDPRLVYDYDGDGRCDPAVWRSGDRTWYYLGSSNNPDKHITYATWGNNGAFPNPGDFDGDGKGDFMVQLGGIQNPEQWWILNSRDLSVKIIHFASGLMFGAPGDYDGDGKIDVSGTITETPNLAWYHVASSSPNQNVFLTRRAWGPSGGTRNRTQGDYDGDGKSDYAVWVEGATASDPTGFWVLPSSGAPHFFVGWGMFTTGTNDFPVAGYNNR